MRASWDSFFIAQVSASAALTGLVFVALSINLRSIMEASMLVDRAAEAVVLLVQPVVVGLAVLAPARSIRTTGLLALVAALAGFLLITRFVLRGHASALERPRREYRARVVLAAIATLPAIAGAVALLAGSTAGFALLAFGAVTAIGVGIFDAWILLVEILR